MSAAAPHALTGELTIHTAADRKAELLGLLEGTEGDVVLELSGVTEIDTAGLQLLLVLSREAAHAGRALSLAAASRAVSDVLAIAHLSTELTPLTESVR